MIKVVGFKEVDKQWVSEVIINRIKQQKTSIPKIANELKLSDETIYNCIKKEFEKNSIIIKVAKKVELELIIINSDEGKKYFVK